MDTKACIQWMGLSTVVILLSAVPAIATIVGGAVVGGPAGAKFIKLSVPLGNPRGPANSVGEDTFNLPNLYGFDEDQNILLKANLATDVGKNPLPAGTIVASHYVFFDPGPSQQILGTVDFDSRVVAIITSTGNLAASDFLAHTGVHYLSPGARGLEPGDSVAINGPNQIIFDTMASSPGDYVRVLTEYSPNARRITLMDSGGGQDSLPPSFASLARSAVIFGSSVGIYGISALGDSSETLRFADEFTMDFDRKRFSAEIAVS